MKKKTCILLFFMLGIFPAASVQAVPPELNYQGRLTGSDGMSLSGSFDMVFSLFDSLAAGETSRRWSEEHSAFFGRAVRVESGIFNVSLGTFIAFPSDLFDTSSLFLEIKIFNQTASVWETLSRVPLTSAPYAIKADDADTIGGLRATTFAAATHTHTYLPLSGGNIGIGTAVPDAPLQITATVKNDGVNAIFKIYNSLSGRSLLMDDNKIDAMGGDKHLYLNNNSKAPVHVPVLQIDGGADLSEPFDVRGADDIAFAPGMLVSIDPSHPGALNVTTTSYDRRIAGVVSGAGGVQPGVVMGQVGTVANGSIPIALTGRVYCYADAHEGAIDPGDLLTSSSIPGHAMKVKDYERAQGAIIGKSMSRLSSGRGLVLILVTLQ